MSNKSNARKIVDSNVEVIESFISQLHTQSVQLNQAIAADQGVDMDRAEDLRHMHFDDVCTFTLVGNDIKATFSVERIVNNVCSGGSLERLVRYAREIGGITVQIPSDEVVTAVQTLYAERWLR